MSARSGPDSFVAPEVEGGPVLVLGATGRVGGALVRQLAATRTPVRAAVRRAGQSVGGEEVETAHLDVEQPDTWPAVLAGVRAMFLLWPPGTAFQRTVFPLIDAAARAGVRRVVFLSVLGADRMRFLPDTGTQVAPEYEDGEFKFTGELDRVTITLRD